AHYRLGARLAARTALGVRETKRALDAFARSASPLPPGSTMPDSTANSSTVAERLGERLLAVYAEQRLTSGDRLVVTAGVRADAGDVPEVNLFGVPTGEHHDLVLHPSIRLEWLAARPAGGVLERLDLHAAYGTADQRVAGSDFLTPERTAEAELGIRAELWDGRAAVDLVGYGRRLSDGIAPTSVVTYGNAARVHNTGIELALAAGLVRSGGVAWDVRLAAWGNRNRFADAFPPLIAPAGPFQEHHIGYPLGGYWGRSFTFADANGNRVIEPSEVTPGSTFVFLGTPIPSHGGSLWSSLVLGGSVRVTGLLEYRAGHHLFNATARSRCLQRVCPELYDRRTSL
ncbi:MAG: TonB-dependent receptor domain-containing protein, partial [Acidimicrobiales bacterium]